MMRSFTLMIASARRRAWSVGLRRIKKVRRCAVLTPTPGSLENSSINAATGGAISLIILEQSRDFHAAGDVAEQLLLRLRGSAASIFGRRQHHHFQFGDIFGVKRFRINFDRGHLKFAVDGNSHSAA